jgi:hypothetical protein
MREKIKTLLAVFGALILSIAVHEGFHAIEIINRGGNVTEVCVLGFKEIGEHNETYLNYAAGWAGYSISHEELETNGPLDEIIPTIMGILALVILFFILLT